MEITPQTDEQQIRELIEHWAAAVRAGDLEGVLASHTDDVVMYDVPPPFEGVRGLEAYRATWPEFFAWLASGAVFEITSLEITAGSDVAFAHALLRCGTPQDLATNPENRLRLTWGLVKDRGRWAIRHEHHSFPLTDETTTSTTSGVPATAAEGEIRAIHEQWFARTAAKDLDGLMEHIADDIVSYEHDAPLQYDGIAAVREVCRQGLEATSGAVGWDVPDLTVLAEEDLAVAWGRNHMTAQALDGRVVEDWSRGTRVFRRGANGWVMVHQHLSYPREP